MSLSLICPAVPGNKQHELIHHYTSTLSELKVFFIGDHHSHLLLIYGIVLHHPISQIEPRLVEISPVEVVTTQLPNARQQVWVSRVLDITIIKACPLSQQLYHVKNPSMLNVMSAEYWSKNAALPHNGHVSKWVKNYKVGRKPPNRQTTKTIQWLLWKYMFAISCWMSWRWSLYFFHKRGCPLPMINGKFGLNWISDGGTWNYEILLKTTKTETVTEIRRMAMISIHE